MSKRQHKLLVTAIYLLTKSRSIELEMKYSWKWLYIQLIHFPIPFLLTFLIRPQAIFYDDF